MNENTEAIMKVREIFERANLPFMLYGSTLLGIYRDGQPLGSPDVCFLARDYKEDMLEVFSSSCNFNMSDKPNFADKGYMIFDFSPGHLEAHIIYFYKDWAYSNLKGMNLLVWPKYMYENTKTIRWNDLDWRIPSDTKRYLRMFYGKGWKKPQASDWHSAPNKIDVDILGEKNVFELKDEYFNKFKGNKLVLDRH